MSLLITETDFQPTWNSIGLCGVKFRIIIIITSSKVHFENILSIFDD